MTQAFFEDTQHIIFEKAVVYGHHDERDEALREQLAASIRNTRDSRDLLRMASTNSRLNRYVVRFQNSLPKSIGPWIKQVRRPRMIWVRVPVACLLILGGLFSFLPILGIWMLPLGLILLAQDVVWLRRPLVITLAWVEKRWRSFKRWRQ